MLKPRLIAVLLYKNGIIVKSRSFNFHQSTGDPIGLVGRFTDWKADELVYLNINRDDVYKHKDTMSVIGSTSANTNIANFDTSDFFEVIKQVAAKCLIPLTAGGKIKSLEDISLLLKNGADKISINTIALENPSFVRKAAKKFGNQCIVVSVDVKFNATSGKKEVYKNFGKESTGLDPVKWCLKLEKLGAGEILLNSIDRDGMGEGYDLDLIKSVSEKVK